MLRWEGHGRWVLRSIDVGDVLRVVLLVADGSALAG